MIKRTWDQIDERCTRCRTMVSTGAGNQFVDDDGDLQRYCWKCYRKMCEEVEKRYERRTAIEQLSTNCNVESPKELPSSSTDVVRTDGDGPSASSLDKPEPLLGS